MTESSTTGVGTFWTDYQPGFRFSDQPVGSPAFFAEVEQHRYMLEPHIPDIVNFPRWHGRAVIEVGCGIGTDAVQFARAGARYEGVDQSTTAVGLASERFKAEGLPGRFQIADATQLPFADASFDLAFSHGVLHHIPQTRTAITELHRVLRPGGSAIVMLYHRKSLNYYLNIMTLRRACALLLAIPGAAAVVARLTGENRALIAAHRDLLRKHGLRYVLDRQLFLSHNTDGPGNHLSKVYSRATAAALFSQFDSITTQVRFLNLRLIPGGDRIARFRLARRGERTLGWHLYITATKASEG